MSGYSLDGLAIHTWNYCHGLISLLWCALSGNFSSTVVVLKDHATRDFLEAKARPTAPSGTVAPLSDGAVSSTTVNLMLGVECALP
jgi:hypothetical protein